MFNSTKPFNYLQANVYALVLSFGLLVLSLLTILSSYLVTNRTNRSFTKTLTIIIYGFSVGFFVSIGYLEVSHGLEQIDSYPGYQKGLIVGASTVIIFSLIIALKFFVKFKHDKSLTWSSPYHVQHDHCHVQPSLCSITPSSNNHSVSVSKLFSVLLTIPHRLVSGIVLGYTVIYLGINEGTPLHPLLFTLAFLVHFVPEEFLINYRIKQSNLPWSKVIVYNLIFNVFLLIPGIYIGTNLGSILNSIPILSTLVSVSIGLLFIFSSLFELFPEVIFEAKDFKSWLYLCITISLGIVFSFTILATIGHGH